METKFRAYDINSKRFINDYEVYINKKSETYWEHYERGMQEEVDIEINMFTGILDNNNIEIYEKDIVLDKLNNEFGEVVFEEGCFLVLWQEGQSTVYQATREFYIEVVGNVYENKNLLRSE